MNKEKIAILGGGIAGLTVAYRLIKKGFTVKIFEAQDNLGGLARTAMIQGEALEIYYHHF